MAFLSEKVLRVVKADIPEVVAVVINYSNKKIQMDTLLITILFIQPYIGTLILGLLFLMRSVSFGQSSRDSLSYKNEKEKRAVKVSLLSNYYEQDGNRSAINGGLGSQKLNSYAEDVNIYFPVHDSSAFKLGGGVDYFTSASLQDIDKGGDAKSVSGDETRKYINLGYDLGLNNGLSISPSAGLSSEYDVTSGNVGLSLLKPVKKWNANYSSSFSFVLDRWMMVFPGEFRPVSTDANTSASSNSNSDYAIPFTYNGNVLKKDGQLYPIDWRQSYAFINNYSFAINRKMNAAVGLDLLIQTGLLSSPFNRVYFNDGEGDESRKEVRVENLPRERKKIALSARYNWFINPYAVVRSHIRYYEDSWGIKATTLAFELPVKILPSLSVTPFYRYHVQEAADYYRAYGQHVFKPGEYYTSDMDLGEFYANKFGLGLRYVPFKRHAETSLTKKALIVLKDASLRYAKYKRQDNLHADVVSLELNFEINK